MADKEAARKSGKFLAVCLTPDVCKTPVGNTLVPVPYPITANLSNSRSTSPNVRFGGKQAFILDQSTVSNVKGDEAGTAGGVKSGVNRSKVKPIKGSSSVRINNKPVIRHGDPCEMNNGNTVGRIIYQGSGKQAFGSFNPPVKPETPAEEQAKVEKKGLWSRISDGVHTALDVAGFVPGLGAIPDLANAALYGLEGNAPLAGLSAVAAVPGIGDGIKAGSMVVKGGKQVLKQAEKELVVQSVKKTEQEIALSLIEKKAAKKTAEKTGGNAVRKAEEEAIEKTASKETAEAAAGKESKDGIRESSGKKKYHRNKSERRKALKRDADDPNSKLTKEQREFIKEHDGHKVPVDCEVAHEKPLYTKKTTAGKKELDIADNMQTIPKSTHKANHRPCGITYHDYPR